MNPDKKAWCCLCDFAETQLSAGFVDRTVCAARKPTPSPSGQMLLSASTAMLCAIAVVVFFSQSTRAESSRNIAGWQQIAAANDDSGQPQ